MRFINRWKVPGAYDNPKGMTNHSYNPKGVMNAVFSTSSSSMATCQYPLARSKVVNQLALLKDSSISSMRGKGYASAFVTALTFL